MVLALASVAAAFTVDTTDDGADEQASGPTTTAPADTIDTTPTPTTFVEPSITTVPGGTASTSPAMTGAGSSSPTTAAGASSTPTTSGSGFSSTGPGAVADGTVPIAETGGLPFAVPGIAFLALASLLGLAARRAGAAYAEKS